MDSQSASPVPFRDHLAAAFDRIELAHERHDADDRTRAPIAGVFGPFLPGAVTVISSTEPTVADRLALAIVDGVAVSGQAPVVLVNPATDQTSTVLRMVAAGGHLDLSRLAQGRVRDTDWSRVSASLGRLAAATVDVIDNPDLDPVGLEQAIIGLASRQGTPTVVVLAGHLLRAAAPRPTRVEELDDLVVALKRTARRTASPIVVAFTTPDPGVGRGAADTHIALVASDPAAVNATVWRADGRRSEVALVDLEVQSRVVLAPRE
jgi:replicative DNA helicase